MTNITKKVWEKIDTDPVLKRSMRREVINKRALADYLIKQRGVDASLNAVISAIRRYEENISKESIAAEAEKIVIGASISSKNSITGITLEKDEEVESLLPKLFYIIESGKNQVLRIIQANQHVKIFIDDHNRDEVKQLFSENKIVKVEEELAEVTLDLDPEAWKISGVISLLTTELSLHKVNIMGIMSCIPEIIIFFHEEDLMDAYNILYGVCKKKDDKQ